MENNSSTSHFKEPAKPVSRPLSIRPLWLLPVGALIVNALLQFMPAGFMERTLRLRVHEVVTLPAPRLQIMGDSVTAGINAANFAETSGLPADSIQNYSLPGTSPLFAYFTLRRELASGRVPGRIIFAPHPANLATPMIDRFIGRFATLPEMAGVLTHRVALPDWLFGLACRASIAMRDREEFRLALTQGDFGFFRTLHKPAASVMVSQTRIVPPSAPPAKSVVSPADFPPQLSQPFSVDSINALYMDRFCDLAGQHGIPVIWVTVPVIGLYKQHAMAGGGQARFDSFINGLVARHHNVTLLHPQLLVFPDNYFIDGWHFNLYADWLFSRELGADLKNSAPAPSVTPR